MIQKLKEKIRKPLIPQENNILAICFIALALLTGGLFLTVLFIALRLNHLANRETTFVQLNQGEAIYATEEEVNYRLPSVLKNFIKTWLQLTFNWEGTIPGTEENDPGFRISGDRVPLAAYFGSLLLEPEFGKAFLPELAQNLPAGILNGETRQVLIIEYISEPRKIGDRSWEVDIISTRIITNFTTGTDERIPFNKTFTLTATVPQQPTFAEDSGVFERKVYDLKAAGLQIEKIVGYLPK